MSGPSRCPCRGRSLTRPFPYRRRSTSSCPPGTRTSSPPRSATPGCC
uniref:Beta-hexosaminidase n=1 Tax=Arundo donax TaxID=35708 RepID=A0A0A9B6L5_ARUDO